MLRKAIKLIDNYFCGRSVKKELIEQNISLQDKNWFKTGGEAKYFAAPKKAAEFREALLFAKQNNLELFFLGEGANILISDRGFDGLVLKPENKGISHVLGQNGVAVVTAGASASFDALIEYCLKNNILGLEEFSGIPGTIGGSVFINIHYFEFLLSNFLVSAKIIKRDSGEILSVKNSWFNFGYDYSTLHKKQDLLFEATFKLRVGSEKEVAYAAGRKKEIIRHRRSRYPNENTCGSFFRNFHTDEVTIFSNSRKMIYVAYYLDKIGVKGELCYGDAIVSYKHANMIVNKGNATSLDIINVAGKMQELVFDNFGIIPVPECQLIGFEKYPLLTAELQNSAKEFCRDHTAKESRKNHSVKDKTP